MGDSLQTDSLLDQLLEEVHQLRLILSGRLHSLETSVCFLNNTCSGLANKVDEVQVLLQRTHDTVQALGDNNKQSRVTSSQACTPSSNPSNLLATGAGVLRLPGVDDYPDGTWLGDPDSPSQRVRSPITPQNLLHINSTCVTAEKMALTLLDYLFSRDELANSNISGRSRNNKKQLDPMMVYGIRCHLQYKFNMSTKEWTRICQNMDSKCRSAWKKRNKNLEQHHEQHVKMIKTCHGSVRSKESPLTDELGFDFEHLHSSNLDLSCVKVMGDSPCELRILHGGGSSGMVDTHGIVLHDDRILTAVQDKSSLLLGQRPSRGLSLAPVVINCSDSLTLAPSTSFTPATLTVTPHGCDIPSDNTTLSTTTSNRVVTPSVSLSISDPDTGGEGVIVITGDPAHEDEVEEDGGILEIGEALPHLQRDASSPDSPSPPVYKLLTPQHSAFHSSLQLPSSSAIIKHEIGDVDDLHESSLHRLTMSGLGVIRVKDLKDEALND